MQAEAKARAQEGEVQGAVVSPQTYKHLKPGKYRFAVRAVGPGGTDPSPAKKRFKIA